jgi:hypothetical protein
VIVVDRLAVTDLALDPLAISNPALDPGADDARRAVVAMSTVE